MNTSSKKNSFFNFFFKKRIFPCNSNNSNNSRDNYRIGTGHDTNATRSMVGGLKLSSPILIIIIVCIICACV